MVIFAGLHGPAIQAVEHILYTLGALDLAFLAGRIGNERYFQSIFKIPELERVRNTTGPAGLVCDRADKCSPKALSVKFGGPP